MSTRKDLCNLFGIEVKYLLNVRLVGIKKECPLVLINKEIEFSSSGSQVICRITEQLRLVEFARTEAWSGAVLRRGKPKLYVSLGVVGYGGEKQ